MPTYVSRLVYATNSTNETKLREQKLKPKVLLEGQQFMPNRSHCKGDRKMKVNKKGS